MNIHHLREFITLAEVQNYLEAAEELFISQSTLSKHIQALEKELDVSLFTRSTRQVQLSPYGNIYLPYAKKIIKDYEESLSKLEQFKNELQQTITIGTIPIMASYGITHTIMEFRKRFPQTKVKVIEADSQRLINMLDNNECDIAFIRDDHQVDVELNDMPFASDYLVAVLPKAHPLAKETSISLNSLAHENFLFLQKGTILYDLSVKACQKAGFEPFISYTGKRAENIIALVQEGMGVSLLMRKPIAFLNPKGIALVPITPKIQTEIKLYHSKNHQFTPITKAFMDFIAEQK